MFSGLRQGMSLYVLDKTEKPKVVIGQVENVTAPRPMYKTYNPAASFNANMQTVVDIVVKCGNDRKEFIGIPSNAIIHSYGDYVIAENKDNIIQEVDAMLQNSRSIVDNVEQHKQNISACEDILKQLSPVYAKEQQRDEALDSISDRMDKIENVLARLESAISNKNQNGND